MAETPLRDRPLAERIAWVREDRAHGASALAREAADILHACALAGLAPEADARAALVELHQAAQELAASRSSMIALANTVGRIWAETQEETRTRTGARKRSEARPALEAARQSAEVLLTGWAAASQQITSHARPSLQGTILTHSLSGTVQAALIACRDQVAQVYVTEGRPRCEGREMAQALSVAGLRVTLLTDAQAGLFIPECAAVVVGADSVLADGSVINKAGTYLLALAARAARPKLVPFLALAETLKIAPSAQPHLEEMDPAEVLPTPAPAGVNARNLYFDRTPARLVSTIITERGPLDRAQVRKQAAKARHWARLLEQPL